MGVHRKKKSTTRRLSSQTVRGAKRQRSIPRSNPSSSRTKTHTAQIPGILERITDGIVAFDAQMNYLFVNESAGQSLGRKPADLIGKNYWVEFPEAEGTPFANAYMKALKTQEPLVIEDHYAPWDRWFENRIYPSKDGLCIFFSEITERKKAEEALQVQSRFINTLANTLPAIIYVYDMETQSNVYSNDGMESVLGFTPREVQEMGAEVFARLIHPDDLEAVIEFQSHVASARDESVLEIEYRMRRKGGDWRWLHSYERPFVRNAEGGWKQKIGIAVDITERKRDELLLETEKQILEMIASDATLPEALEKIVLNIEALARETIASVLLLGSDGLHVHYGAAPHLPKSYSDALEGAPIGPVAGSCGTALYRRETVIVTDIETDPLWDDYRTLARAHGLRACWSTPVIAFDGKVLASFAMYYRETRQPEAQDLKLIERAVHLARIAIERKQVEEALQESERRLSTLMSNLPGAVYRARNDRAWATEFVSEGILHLTGYPASDFTQQRREIGDLIHPADRERVWDDIQSALGERRSYELTYRITAADGAEKWVWERGGGVYDPAGSLLALEGFVTDITERKRAEEEQRASEAQLKKVLEVETVGVMFWDLTTGCMTDANDAFLNMMGYSRSEVEAGELTWQKLTPPEYVEASLAEIRKFEASGRVGPYEKEYFRKDGGRQWLVFAGSSLGGNTCVEFCVDISDRKRAEEELFTLNAELEQRVADRTHELEIAKDRAESADHVKSAFLATMSHELRTPLNSIIGFTGVLLQGLAGPLNDEQSKQLGMARDSARHLLALINDVLDISKIEAGQLEIHRSVFNIRSTIESALRFITQQAQKKGLSISATISSQVGDLESDPRRVEQILLNLLSNAVKFTERGEVRIECRSVDGFIETRVVDTGIGIRPEDLPNLFVPFRQIESGLNRRHEGTGLGLSICKNLVEILGGSICVHSEWEKGSVFTFTLPTLVGRG